MRALISTLRRNEGQDMHTFRDAKAMAKAMRAALADRK